MKLCDHIKSENGKDDIEKILRVLALDELEDCARFILLDLTV